MSPRASSTTCRTRGATKPSSTVRSGHLPRKPGEVQDNRNPTRQITASQQIQELMNREAGKARSNSGSSGSRSSSSRWWVVGSGK